MKQLPTWLVPVAVVAAGAAVFTLVNLSRPAGNRTSSPEQVVNTPAPSNISATRPMMGENSFSLAVCDEVTKEMVEEIIGKTIVEVKDRSDSQTTSCTYYLDKKTMENIVVVVAFMDPETQKNYYSSQGNPVKKLSEIPMDNFSVWDKTDKEIGGIYLLMAPKKFVRVERSNPGVTGNAESIALAKKVAGIILTGK